MASHSDRRTLERLQGVAQQWLPPVASEQVPPLVMPEESLEHASGAYTISLDRKSWKVLAVIAVFALVVMGWFWFRGQPHPASAIPFAVNPSVSAASSSVGNSNAAMSEAGITSNASGAVVVHIAGAVRKPGLQQLPSGSRVADAIKAAGGFTSTKVQDSVNLARLLVDGEQIFVGALPSSGGTSGSGTFGGTSSTQSGSKVSLNSANQQQLESLPGVGPSLAQRIMEYRSSHGGFRNVEELDDVAGIGSATLSRLRPLVSM